MKDVKRSIVLIIISCFTGQLLAGCNLGSGSDKTNIQNQAISSKDKKHNLNNSSNGLKPFDEANSDNGLWANVFGTDLNFRDSSIYFSSKNNTDSLIQLVGCEGDAVDQKAVSINLDGGFTFDTKMKETPLELQAAGYPDLMIDTSDAESSYIKFNDSIVDNPYGKILCHYRRTITLVGEQYFDLEVDYYNSASSVDGGQQFDYPTIKANQDSRLLPWYEHWGIQALVAVTLAVAPELRIQWIKRKIKNVKYPTIAYLENKLSSMQIEYFSKLLPEIRERAKIFNEQLLNKEELEKMER